MVILCAKDRRTVSPAICDCESEMMHGGRPFARRSLVCLTDDCRAHTSVHLAAPVPPSYAADARAVFASIIFALCGCVRGASDVVCVCVVGAFAFSLSKIDANVPILLSVYQLPIHQCRLLR